VICEKPICVTAQEARRIEETLTRSRAAVHPSLANRFRPDIARLRGVIRSGALGPIRHVSARWLRRSGIPGTGWHMRRAQSGGGVLMDLGPHLIDAVLWVCNYPDVGVLDCVLSDRYLGDPDRVAQWYGGAPTATDAPVDVEDTALLKLEIGMATCDIEIAWAGPYPHDTTDIEVVGEAGTAKLSTLFGFSQDTPLRQSTLQIFDARGLRSEAFDLDPRQAPFFNMLSAITESATAGGEPPLDVQDALRVAHIIDVAYRRHRTPSRDRTAPKIACRRQRTRHRMVD
jgi:oxidoreductase